ncbi:MAG TPA: SPOR domain-containing protein [Bacteroidia bacterium]|nr:SPOR domain-containing protein [Bacteroidia bacterium]
MAAIDEYICELLYEHDCVIVPSLGGFLASNVQAKLNPGQNTILPPRRKIAFNIYLRQNDGLLANHLVEYERVSYTEAIRKIEEYVQDCFAKLDKHRKVIVERVGTIYYDKERHLLFEPFRQTQFRKDAFGLSPVQFLPVERDNAGSRIEHQRKELMKARPSVKAERTFLKGKKTNYKILGVIAIAGTLLWFSFNLFILQPGGGDLGSLNPFTLDTTTPQTSTSVETTTRPESNTISQAIETVFVASTEPVVNHVETVRPKNSQSDLRAMVEPAKTAEAPVVIKSTVSSQGNYHVVAGAFKIAENADAFLIELQNKGFSDAHIIRKGLLNYVSYHSYHDRASALVMLDSLRAQKSEGWIWHN